MGEYRPLKCSPTAPLALLMTSHSQEHACHCGHVFAQPGHLFWHQRTCSTTKRIVTGALAKAKEALKAKKGHCCRSSLISQVSKTSPQGLDWLKQPFLQNGNTLEMQQDDHTNMMNEADIIPQVPSPSLPMGHTTLDNVCALSDLSIL